MAGSQVSTSVSIINSLKGFMGLSLTYTIPETVAVPSIAAGSIIEVNSAFFIFASDEAINATSWSAITTGSCYIYVAPSGSAGTQILSPYWSITAPSWYDDKNGYYLASSPNDRCVGSATKVSAASCINRQIFGQFQNKDQHGQNKFTATGTWTCPDGVWRISATGCAAGEAGTAGSAGGAGAGGRGGAWIFEDDYNVIPGTLYTFTIGAHPNATSMTADSGTTTIFTLACNSIAGGAAAAPGTPAFGAGGVSGGSSGFGGGGGGSLGSGGHAATAAGKVAGFYGGGGGGGAGGATNAGGSGGSAILTIRW